MGSTNQYVLAMYDIRGKQDFIFNTNHIKEIVGGSCIIRDCFDRYFYDAAKGDSAKGVYHGGDAFTEKGFEDHLADGYIGELVYDGGGNFLVVFKDEDTFRDVTYHFTRKVYEEIGTLRILATCAPGVHFDDYPADRDRLYQKHRLNENSESGIAPYATLPVVQVDPGSSRPLTAKYGREKVTKESLRKYEAYDRERENKGEDMGEKFLDKLVTKKGEDSLLAIIYIDGNNMGAKVKNAIRGLKSYEDCVAALRRFSESIEKDYITDRIREIETGIGKRPVIMAGDEINLICNAHEALKIARTYLEGLRKSGSDKSSCAGIAVFHSHAPYADAYRIAEECCESGKKVMKEKKASVASFLDFHYCQGAIGTSLEEIRKAEGETNGSRPWLIYCADDDREKLNGCTDFETVEKIAEFLRKLGRSNVKGLMSVAKESLAALDLELKRIEAHMPENKKSAVNFEFVKGLDPEVRRKLIFDAVSVFDIWFREED